MLVSGSKIHALKAIAATATKTQLTVDDGEKLFQANCATCHGLVVAH